MFNFKIYTTGNVKHHVIWVSKKYSISIHKIIYTEKAKDRYPHDHGLDFLSIILWGGYTEELFKDKYASIENGKIIKRKLGSWHIMKNSASHKVIDIKSKKSAWTLFITWNYEKNRQAYIYTPEGRMKVGEYYSALVKKGLLEKQVSINEKPSSIKNNEFYLPSDK
jgi:hypothetical protein